MVDTTCGNPTQGYTTAAITDQDNNTPMSVGFWVGYWTNNLTTLEGGVSGVNQATIYFYRNQTNTQVRTINYALSGNAVASTDYTPPIGTITIPQGSWYTSVTVSANNASQTTTKTLGVTITSGTYKIDSQAASATNTILPDYPTLSIQASPTSIFDGLGNSTFTISRDITYVYGGAKTVNFSVGGSAGNGSDYAPYLNPSVTLAPGASSTNITIAAQANHQTTAKTAVLTLTGGNYNISSTLGSATVNLLDNYPTVDLIATNYTATDGQTSTAFEVYRETYYTNGPPLTVNYTFSGTASNGVDFTPTLTNSVTMPAGQGSVLIPIIPSSHTNVVGTKELTLSLSANAAYAIGTNSSATIGLLQDAPTINVAASGPYATRAGQTGQFQITRSGGLSNSLTVNLTLSGTAVSSSDYTPLPTSIRFAANQTATNLNVTALANPPTQGKTVVLSLSTNSNYYLGAYPNAIVTILTTNTTANPTVAGRYWRGTGSDPTYWSLIVPLDYQRGVLFSNLDGNCADLYPGLSAWSGATLYHYDATNTRPQTSYTNRISFNNPVVAFGSLVGGTPLYLGQDYHFGIYAGNQVAVGTAVYISAYYRSNYAFAGILSVTPPDPGSASSWTNYLGSNFQVTAQGYGLTVTLSDAPGLGWGIAPQGGAYLLTQNASTEATNYYYLVQAFGYPGSQTTPLVLQDNGQIGPSMLYTMDFEARPLWRSVFIDQPHFDGSPLPPFYAGMTVAERMTNTPPVTNAVSLAPAACTTLDVSPELRRHPILDQFVSDMGNDPIALANYVLNEIDLTDWMDYNDGGNVAEPSVNLGGVSRGAIGTFLEKQGSPVEQCGLLVYLLRQAGVPATYVYPPHNGLQILDARLSRMLRFQVHGAFSETGQPHATNTMIPVNYPWVAAYIGTNWVHIFPWLKDYSIVEGRDLYDYMPPNYGNAYGWVKDYIYGATNLLSLAVDDDATPRVIFPAYLKQTLLQNHPGVSVDDLGVQVFNRRHNCARWQDFPTPTWLTNACTAVESLGSSGITNVNPALTNIFDTVSLEVYSVNSPNRDIQTGDMRLADLHNRKFYITASNSAPNQIKLSLVLAPFTTNITTLASFGSSEPSLKSKQVLSLTLDQFDDQLNVRFKYNRHCGMGPSYPIDPSQPFYNFSAARTIIMERPLRKGDVAAICMNYGRVTREMLNVWATDLWQMENALAQNPGLANSVSPDVYQGTTMYLCGMKYYEKCSEFDAFNANLHKINNISTWAAGLSKISPARNAYDGLNNGGVDPILPNVDMFFYEVASVGNGTLRPDSGRTQQMEVQNYNIIDVADFSAEEHQVINSFYQQTNAVSTVRLLQMAQKSGMGIVPLTIENYAAQGATVYQGKTLQNWDSNLWSEVTSAIQAPSTYGYVTAYITPGPITNAAYKGMGALVLGWGLWQALITPQSMNGAFGERFPFGTVAAANTLNYDLWDDPDADEFSIGMQPPSSWLTLAPSQIPLFNAPVIDSQIGSGAFALDPVEITASSAIGATLNTTSQGNQNQICAQNLQVGQQNGNQGPPSFFSQAWSFVADPVNNITGEFYVDQTDLQLPGPIPLALRRNYSSQNLADNQFGFGWKLSLMPYLAVSVDATNIYAADMDGSVLAYVRSSTNLWLPTLAANPTLDNNTAAGVGGLANRLRDRLVQTVSGTTNYTLYGADGSVRTFQVMSFNNGVLNQTRPYLLQWTDNRGNYYTFTYGTNASLPGFGQVRRIQCSNGNYLGFYFNVYGHIVEAYSGDGRRLRYEYDDFGDLITVTLPDYTTRSYVYQHRTQAVTNGAVVTQQPYSTHLIIEEDKPDGRALVNAYDSQRRVTNQLSTAGQDLNPIRTASFSYANNFNFTNAYTNLVTGYTLVMDANNQTSRYDYTNSLITKITDPLYHTIQQTWYPDNATAPGYPRSVSQRIDQRGLITQYQYDSNGNVTNTAVTGDLLGYGTNSTAVTTAIYNSNCLAVWVADAVGNSVSNIFDSTFAFLPQQVIRFTGATPVSTDYFVYGSASNVVTNGGIQATNKAFGLLTRSIRAYSSPDAATNDLFYNGQGFVTNSVQYTGTGDPAISNSLFYNERNELVERTDAAGRTYTFTYDDLGRPLGHETFDAGAAAPMDWEDRYYNDNGELTWIDGPRYNPEDYVYFDYDGAGRKIEETQWRSQGKPDGSGVSAVPGYGLFATTFWKYDALGNPTNIVDPLGNYIIQTFDPIGELVQQIYYNSNATALTTSGFFYEPGGLVSYATNALGGITHKAYTAAGKVTSAQYPDGSAEQWNYDLAGRVTFHTVRKGNGYWTTTYDDANRRVINIFHRGDNNTALATNITQLDRRGNVVLRSDELGTTFTNLYDGLDRIKIAAGPPIVTVALNQDFTTYTTNSAQQINTYLYDNCGQVLTVSDALGERIVTTSDPLGRPLQVAYYNSNSATPVRVTSTSYNPDHNSVTVTNGTGANAIVTTTYTDTAGQPVLTLHYPTSGVVEYTWQQFDANGNRLASQQLCSSGGTITTWATNGWTFDGLNRVVTETTKDGAVTSYAYDSLGDVTNRAMPSGLNWSATYNNAGQTTLELDGGGALQSGQTMRQFDYQYFPPGPYGGALWTANGAKWVQGNMGGANFTNSYDFWGQLGSVASGGYAPEKRTLTTYQHDLRGMTTNITQSFADPGTGPTTTVLRGFDVYGRVVSEQTLLNSQALTSASQGWDVAGRRSTLSFGNMTTGFGYQADGLMTAAGSSTFGYANNGLLLGRTNSLRTWFVNQRDGDGRILQTATKVGSQTVLTETNTWRNDGRMSAYTASRDFTDSRRYAYSALAQRLTQESFYLGSGKTITNNYTTDGGQTGGLGLLTSRAQAGGSSASWSATDVDGFGRVDGEQTSLISRSTYGLVQGAGTVSATLDGQPLSVQFDGPWGNGEWRANMDLAPGDHTLQVSAVDPSGLCFGSATNTFACATNSGDNIQNYYFVDGNVEARFWVNALGDTTRSQWLTWDAFNRLIGLTDRDAQNNGHNWSAVYDGLGRRLQTTSTLVTNGVAISSQPTIISSLFDPQVEFLEVGVTVNRTFSMKTYGPDANGVYGGMQGVGGLEAIKVYGHSAATSVVQDYFGNVIGTIASGVVSWNPARFSSYGPVPGYQQSTLSLNTPLAQSLGYRGKRVDETGLIYLGARLYDPVAGRFMSADPLGHDASQDLYSFCGGDPVNSFDASGRLASGFYAGLKDAPVPATASSAFMNGYYGGGVTSGFGEGLGEGSAIVANTATLGQINSLSTYTSTLQGGAYDASRVFSGIGVGAFALASGAAALEVPGIYAGATAAAYSPWAPVVAGGAAAGAYTYSQGGNASDVALSTVTGSAMVYMAAPFPMGGQNAPPATLTGVQANKAAGDAWEAELLNTQLPQTQNNIQPQITIRSSGPSGLNVRLDAVGTDTASRAIVLTDGKASATAPLTRNQTIVYPELPVYGGTVVGAGKPPYTGGTVIPPTTVNVIRKR
jgi:RHS repeat-associated protein